MLILMNAFGEIFNLKINSNLLMKNIKIGYILVISCLRNTLCHALMFYHCSESADQMMGLGTRPGSSVARSNRPFSTSYRMASATIKRNVGRGRLAPLDRAKTPSVVRTHLSLSLSVGRGRLAPLDRAKTPSVVRNPSLSLSLSQCGQRATSTLRQGKDP